MIKALKKLGIDGTYIHQHNYDYKQQIYSLHREKLKLFPLMSASRQGCLLFNSYLIYYWNS
jgi:hypothetical protein